MNYIKYDNKIIEYEIDKGKRKHIYISIQDGKVIVKAPKRVSNKYIEAVVDKKKDWIYEKINIYNNSPKSPKEYIDGEIFKVLGEDCTLKIFYKNIKRAKLLKNGKYLNVEIPEKFIEISDKTEEKKIIEKLINKFYIETAEIEMKEAMSKLTKLVGLQPNEYRIRNLKRSWGNCSSTRNISINKDLAMYSKKAMEYVCLHELCHLRFMNHSKEFWNMVGKFMPDYKVPEFELKKR